MYLRILRNYLYRNRGKVYAQEPERFLDMKTLLLFTCDLEFSPEVQHKRFSNDRRLTKGCRILTDILTKYEINSTLFTQGKLCIRYPEIVEEFYRKGHEIGSHGFDHIPMTYFWPTSFLPRISPVFRRRVDIRKSKEAIYSITKREPISFRSPYLAVDEKTLMILETEGFLLDSSLYNPAFGRISYPYHPSKDDIASKGEMKILEVPLTVSVVPQRAIIYTRYPSIFGLDERQIEKTILVLRDLFGKLKYNFALFVTVIHPYELCSSIVVSRVTAFLEAMKRIGAQSLTFHQLMGEYERLEHH